MNEPDKSLEDLLVRVKDRELASHRRALLWTLIPAAVGMAFLVFGSWRLATASKEVSALRGTADFLQIQVGAYNTELTELRTELQDVESRLAESLDLSRFNYVVGPDELKEIVSNYPNEGRILDNIRELQIEAVPWRLGGRSPEEGFDSPGLVEYLLQTLNLVEGPLTDPESSVPPSQQLFESLTPTNAPRTGDLAFYPGGYVMFYFRDPTGGGAFVAGMGPIGIVTFYPDFETPNGFRRWR